MDEDPFGVEMTESEIARFLAAQGDGVLSFGGTPGYAIPVSFAYDGPNDRIVFQFVFPPDSDKREYVEADDPVTLVAYEWTDPDDWRSVVVTGRLSRIEAGSDAETAAAAVFAEHATPIGMSVLERPADELDPEWFELECETRSGRHSPVGGE